MANPSRIPDPRLDDPLDPTPFPKTDPLAVNPRLDPANSQDPRIDRISNRTNVRSGSSGLIIAAVVIVLAVVAYLFFAPGSAVAPGDQPLATEPAATPPADTTAPAPDAAAPATPPADTTAPAPDAAAPATPPADTMAPAPDATAPAPNATEPAQPAPAEPAPAQ